MKHATVGDSLVIFAEGRWDANAQKRTESEIMELLKTIPAECTTVILDMEKLTYISSSGLRVLLMLQKKSERKLQIRNVSMEVYDILQMTGITELLEVFRKPRTISIEGCELIGSGGMGDVYRLNPDTIVKVYRCPQDEAMAVISREHEKSRIAFTNGIPTAISYDMVKVGDRYGSVFELVGATTFHSMFQKDPFNGERIIKQYVDLIKSMHATDIRPGLLPSASEQMLRELDFIKSLLTEEQAVRIRELLEDLPQDNHLVHGDPQMKNMMLSADGPYIIDMEMLATGQGIFDLQAMYVTYQAFREDDPQGRVQFLQLTPEACDFLWNRILVNYFGTEDSQFLNRVQDEIRVVAYVHFLYLLKFLHLDGDETGRIQIRHSVQHLEELLPKVGRLNSWSLE